jgi:hypothetical protein
VLETVTKEEENKRERVGCVQLTPARSGTPDSVRCARLAGDELAAFRKTQRCTAIIHRTVRWCTGLSGEPTVASATVGCAIRGRRMARSNGRLGTPDTPDSPVCQLTPRTNGRMRQIWKEIAHQTTTVTVRWCTRTLRCTTRQKASLAF